MPNKLINETSPYLLQHVDNPVDWYPWGEEALKLALETDRPILLSVGYAACHWCHVMAHESFEDDETAEFMNEHFVNIKVDREERPDLDSIYMNAVQAMTGQGGWPMTVALTPDGRPFFGGTYYPPQPRMGMPSFGQVLASITNAWKTQRQEIDQSADKLAEHLGRSLQLARQRSSIAPETVGRAVSKLSETFDKERGGFGGAPKFPQPMTIEFLLHAHHQDGDPEPLQMAEVTLAMMVNGGIYDHLGGGFARYSTDANWLVPHFEKMLYDNALLARVYLHAWQVTGRSLFRRVVEETLDFMAAEMMHKLGGFFSSYDADSEGVEGKFYVWSADEIKEVLGDDADIFMLFYDVSERGNWEGSNILNVPRDYEQVASLLNMSVEELQDILDVARKRLLDVRGERIAPGLDDKVLTSWNGLALAAFAEAGRILDRPDYRDIATQNATFLHDTVRAADGRLLRTWKEGSIAKFNAYLEDYAFLSDGLLALYQSTFEEKWFVWAKELCDLMLAHFSDHANGGFFDTSDDHEPLIKRPKELQDNAIPSGNAMAAKVLLKMSLFTGEMHYWDISEKMIASMDQVCAEYPAAFAVWLDSAAFILDEPKEVAIMGESGAPDTNALIETVYSHYAPNLVVATGNSSSGVPLLSNREAIDGRATAYICQRFVCKRPLAEPGELLAELSPGS